jgi:hypothetical protein
MLTYIRVSITQTVSIVHTIANVNGAQQILFVGILH